MRPFSAGARNAAAVLAVFVAATTAVGSVANEAAEILPERAQRTLETALLPLSIDTVAIPRELGVHPGGGGGITVVGDTIIVIDVQGAFFTARGDVIAKLALPEISNHAADYEKFARKPFQLGPFGVNSGFVVHDLESRREPGGIRLFVSYERYLTGLNTTALAVSAILLDEDFQPLGDWDEIYEGPPLVSEWYSGIAGGGRMLARGDDLYLTAGDYNQDNVFMHSRLEAQEPDSDFGKILKIDLRTKTKSRVSLGHRNPQGLAVTANGTIYSTEHGPQGGDELNRIVPGKNYGWPIDTYGAHYGTYTWPNSIESAQPFEKPVFAWVPSIGVSNLVEATNFHPAWDGDLLVGSLRAQSLFRLRRDGDNRVVYSEPVLLGERLRDIVMMPDGRVALWTDSAKLIFVGVDRAKLAANHRPPQ